MARRGEFVCCSPGVLSAPSLPIGRDPAPVFHHRLLRAGYPVAPHTFDYFRASRTAPLAHSPPLPDLYGLRKIHIRRRGALPSARALVNSRRPSLLVPVGGPPAFIARALSAHVSWPPIGAAHPAPDRLPHLSPPGSPYQAPRLTRLSSTCWRQKARRRLPRSSAQTARTGSHQGRHN